MWVEIKLYSSMTATLEVCEWSGARPGRTLPPGKTRYSFSGGWVVPSFGLDGAEIIVSISFQSWTLQPVSSRYTD